MKQLIFRHKNPLTGTVICLLLGLAILSFNIPDSPIVHLMLDETDAYQDTVPFKKSKRSMTMKEFDRLSENLDKEIATGLGKLDLAKVEAGLKQVDIDKIMKQVESSLKDNDTEKMLAEVKKELAHLNLDELKSGTGSALASAGSALEKAKLQLSETDKDLVKKEMSKLKLELEKSRDQHGKIDMSKLMGHARAGIDKAKLELKQIKTMFNEMEKDGLINSKKGFRIEYKDKNLFINNSKQPGNVTDKYRKYFKDDHFEITIDKEQ